MKHFSYTIIFLLLVSSFAWAQERVDITTCAGTGTGIVCVAPADSLYKLCVKVTPGPCSDKNYTIDWGDGKVEKIVLSAALTLNHEYDLKTFVKNCQSGEFKASIFVENATCPNDNKGFRVTFNKNPQAQPDVSTACEGQSIYINNKSCPVSSDVKFLWEFSDGQVSNSTYPSISFSDPNKTYKVKLTATSQNCGNSSKEIDFKISKLPVPNIKTTGTSVINKDTVVCLSGGGVISLDGTVSTDETDYYWQVSGGKFTFQDKTGNYSDVIRIKLEEVKEYTITFTARNNCGSKILVKKIKVVDLPLLSLTPQPDVCEEIAYKIPNPVEEAVYSLNGKTVDPSQSIPLVFSATPYVISAKLSNACGTQMVSDTFMVGAAQAVKILTVGKDTVVCVSAASITFKANFTGGDWTGLTTQGNEKVFIPTTPGDYTVSYSKGVGKCFSKDEVHVKVDGIQATATDQAICAGTPFTLLKASPTGGAWSTNSCINCLKGDTLLTGGLSSNQVELTYSVSSATGCKASAAAKVTLGRPKANFSIGGGCAGGTFQPTNTSSGAGAYAWFVNGKSVSSESSPKLNLSPGLQKIMLVAQAGNCSDTLRKEVTIVAPPSPISFTPNTSLGCSPLKVTLQPDGTATAGSEYSWDFGNGSVYKGFEPPSQVFENQEKQNRTFKIVVTVKNSCGQETESKEVVVRPRARAEIGVDSTTLRCTPAQILFSNRSSGHDKDQSHWTFGDGITRTTPSDTVYHSFAARDSSRTFRVQLDVMSACGRDTASVSIQVYPTTVKALYTISKSVVCPGEEVRFSDASVPKPTSWIWKFGDGTISTLPNPTHTFAGAQKSYKVTLIAFTSCGYDSTQLTVKTTDAISGNFDDIPLACEGSAIQFVNKTDTQLGFFWDFGDGSPLDSSHYSPVHTYSKTGNYTTTLSVFRGSKTCQVVAKKAVITVVSAVRANFGFNKDSVFCAPGPVAIVNLSENADTFSWRFSDGRTSAVASPALPFEPGLYSVKLVASKGGFCKDSVERAAAVTVKQCQVDIPTAFTPNGDGYGDRYTLFGSGILRIDKLLIRNRWGEIVFEMKDVLPGSQQPDASWDGTYKGQPAPADMYVYEAVILYVDNRRSEKLRGNIYLAR